jgi:hypothetical protein
MKPKRILRVLKFIALGTLAAAVFSLVVMSLWNWLMPALFGLHAVTFWQALGLLVLSKLFFGGFRGRSGPPMFWRRRMMERWEQMTPEEREKFRESLKGGCGPFGAPKAEPKV